MPDPTQPNHTQYHAQIAAKNAEIVAAVSKWKANQTPRPDAPRPGETVVNGHRCTVTKT
jgi:hypothetical protein